MTERVRPCNSETMQMTDATPMMHAEHREKTAHAMRADAADRGAYALLHAVEGGLQTVHIVDGCVHLYAFAGTFGL